MRRHTEAQQRAQFVIVETISAAVLIAVALVATAVLHVEVFGGVLLLFAGIALGHALAIRLGLAHPPRDRSDRDPGSGH